MSQNINAVRADLPRVKQIDQTLKQYRIEKAAAPTSITKPQVQGVIWAPVKIRPDVTIDTRETVLQDLVKTVGPLRIIDKQASTTVNIPVPDVCWGSAWGIPYPYPCLDWVGCNVGYSFSTTVGINQINVRASGIPFSGQADVKASASVCGIGPSASYNPSLNGELLAVWQTAAETIYFSMNSLYLEIYVTIPLPDFVGGDYHLTLGYVDISPYLPNPLYQRRVSLSQTTQLTMPDGSSKTITITPTQTSLNLYDSYLQLTSDLAFH